MTISMEQMAEAADAWFKLCEVLAGVRIALVHQGFSAEAAEALVMMTHAAHCRPVEFCVCAEDELGDPEACE